jgi:hypothetical protein
MKKILSLSFWLLIICGMTNAQNVGVGTTTPTEKLDVNGNVNVNGQLKLNGSAGTANQVMMKDASNNPVWGNLSNYQNIAVFDCNNTASTAGANNCPEIWTVPAGVTSILVECWGGGGGGGFSTGGAGGGYVTAKIPVAPASNASLTIGAGGSYAASGINGIVGGTTSFNIGAITISAIGGNGGIFQDIGGNPELGGNFNVIGLINNYFGLVGMSGGVSETNYTQVSTTEFAKIIKFGNGGDAANSIGSGAKGGYVFLGIPTNNISAQRYAPLPGGGGGADYLRGYYGRGGRIIIRW